MPQEQLRSVMRVLGGQSDVDQATAMALKRKVAQDFRDQLMVGIPTNEDEVGLRRLAAQITANQVVVKVAEQAGRHVIWGGPCILVALRFREEA